MFKNVILAVGVLFFLMLVIFGWEKSWSYVKGTQKVVTDEIENRTPVNLESARISALIQKESDSIVGYEDKICDLEARRDATARAVDEAKKTLTAERDLLKRIKVLLDEKREKYTIGRNTYTYAEVNADALERLEAVKRIQEDIAFKESLVTDLDTSIKQGRGSLGEAGKRLVELKSGMARLEARNANADVRLEVAKLTSAIAGAPLMADSELEKAVKNYDRRVGQKERRAETRLAASNGQFRIDYSASMVTEDASAGIDRLLSEGSKEVPIAPLPQAQPSAVDALKEIRG